MKIVFMGTPAFAVPSLDILLNAGYDIVGVITATDKMGGRGGKQLLESEVKKYAVAKGLNILQPKNLKSKIFVEELKSLKADLQVVVAFRMLPEVVWNMPRLGTINLHGSLLPKYRGAAPINWAIINGDKKTGVSSFKLKHEIDTGDIIIQKSLEIKKEDTAGTVHDRMMYLGANVVAETVKLMEEDSYELQKQDQTLISKAPKIFKDDCKINFERTTSEVYNFIRGLSPYPTAWTIINKDQELKIFKTSTGVEEHHFKAGTIDSDLKSFLRIYTLDGYVQLEELQLSGKRKMDIKSFLNGNNLKLEETA